MIYDSKTCILPSYSRHIILQCISVSLAFSDFLQQSTTAQFWFTDISFDVIPIVQCRKFTLILGEKGAKGDSGIKVR